MIKPIISLILFLGSVFPSYGQLVAKVDERVELTSIVFRLARIPEYTQGRIESYNEDIETYFDDFRYNGLTEYVVKLRNENRLGYSAVASSALFLTIEDDKVILNPNLSVTQLPGYGDQWPEGSFERYVELLNIFYKQTDFHKFYVAHEELYKRVTDKIAQIFADFNAGWFKDFFGVELQYPSMYLALGNGPSNYYIPDYETEAGYGIMIGGRLRFEPTSLWEVVIHEICHHYSNPLFYAHWPEMEVAANKIYEDIKEDMQNIAYGSARESILEWQNNLFTTMYFRDNIPLIAGIFAPEMRDRGFIWLPRSVEFMEFFYENREKYPHIDSFMPELVAFFNAMANEFEWVKYEYAHRQPHVVNVFPANGSNIAKGDYQEIKVTFSKPMSVNGYSVGPRKAEEPYSKIPRSQTKDAYWQDAKTFVIPIEPWRLEKNKKYRIVLGSHLFSTDDYCNIPEDYIITYHTQEE